MSFDERAESFSRFLLERYSLRNSRDVRRNFGVSNGARVIEGGLQLGVTNLAQFDPDRAGRFVVGAQLRFPPGDEVWFGISVGTGARALVQRLDAMREQGALPQSRNDLLSTEDANESDAAASDGGAQKFGARNNNVRLYLAKGGCLHVHNSRFFDALDAEALDALGPAIPVDEIVYAVWPPSAGSRRSLVTEEFSGYLAEIAGQTRVHQVTVWTDGAESTPQMRRLPFAIPISELVESVRRMGGHYPGGEVERLHAALNFHPTKHFAVLPGMSGTGKTRLGALYSRAVHGIESASTEDPLLFVVPVRPEWTDPSGLTGYFDVLTGRYVVPRFLEAMLAATARPDSPVFVILDEMNLARVEYYFADILSCIESGEPLSLHSSDVPLEGSNGASVPRRMPVPSNLYLIGTINIDETTSALSDKVLDRAMLVSMHQVDIPGFLGALAMREPALAASIDASGPLLGSLQAALSRAGQGFGYRTVEEAIRYRAFAVDHLGTSESSVLDDLLVQKLLVKMRGAERDRPMLEAVSKLVSDYPSARRLVERLSAELDELGSFQASR